MRYVLTFLLMAGLLSVANAQSVTTDRPADSTSLKAYAGSYTFASGSPIQKFTITIEKGELYGEADSYGKNKLLKQPEANTYKSTSSYGSIITFVWDAAQKAVTGLTMAIQGTELTAKKDNP
jgi:hypothetical protein